MSVICQKQAYKLIEKETKFVVIRGMGGWAVDEDGQYTNFKDNYQGCNIQHDKYN